MGHIEKLTKYRTFLQIDVKFHVLYFSSANRSALAVCSIQKGQRRLLVKRRCWSALWMQSAHASARTHSVQMALSACGRIEGEFRRNLLFVSAIMQNCALFTIAVILEKGFLITELSNIHLTSCTNLGFPNWCKGKFYWFEEQKGHEQIGVSGKYSSCECKSCMQCYSSYASFCTEKQAFAEGHQFARYVVFFTFEILFPLNPLNPPPPPICKTYSSSLFIFPFHSLYYLLIQM